MNDQPSYNRLKNEKSLYLQQHKDNPVHWWSYGPEALQKAKDDNKPIFLSVGYSTCHWCHVMSEESFNCDETAKILNDNFICIKVDKEEYPDIDNYYQQACQLFTQSGGWPLSSFLLPDMRPYFVGTYFPKSAKDGLTSFKDLLSELLRAYSEENDKVIENAKNVTEAISKGIIPDEKVEFPGHFPVPASVMQAASQFKDIENGGYGSAPKFPNFSFYEWALEQMLEGMIGKEEGEHIIKTLEHMFLGGIYDQVRGGIHRYSVDEKWQVPHFEKMLYDQAGALKVLSKLSLLYPAPSVYDALINTLDYLEKEMLSEDGYFFSGQNADSEGVEGLYFTYSKQEFEDSLNNLDTESEELGKNMEKLQKWFQISEDGSFDQKLNIIALDPKYKDDFYSQESWTLVRRAKEALLLERKMRIPPATDNKGIASWNFMLISALVDVMQYCKIDSIKNQASNMFNIVLEGIYKNFIKAKDGEGMKLRHTTTVESSLPYAEDYVFFAEMMLRVYEISGNEIFKENFIDTLDFIKQEFVKDEDFLTRANFTSEFELYPNQAINAFDTSFKNPAATFFSLVSRAKMLTLDKEVEEGLEKAKEKLIHQALKNPISSGEALRAFTYPDEAYKVLKIPRSWLEDNEFLNFIPYFLPRFVFDFHDEKEETWEICNLSQCEINGAGIKTFIEALSPAPSDKEE